MRVCYRYLRGQRHCCQGLESTVKSAVILLDFLADCDDYVSELEESKSPIEAAPPISGAGPELSASFAARPFRGLVHSYDKVPPLRVAGVEKAPGRESRPPGF